MVTIARWTGREARALRSALRMTGDSFADHLGVSRRTVCQWEKRGTGIIPTPDLQAALDTALRRSTREAKERFTATLITGPALGTASQPPASSLLRHRPGQPVDPTLPGRLTELRAVLTRADARYGARLLTPAVSDQLGQIELMLADAQGPLRARLAELASLYTEFLGWLYDDLGDPERGRALTVRAQGLAELSRNPSLVSYMLMRRAQQAAIAREPELAVALAGQALQGDGTYPRVLAGAAIRRAYGLALNREPDAALESMDTAVELAARPTTEQDPYRLAPWLTPHYLRAHRASVLLVLGRALDAAAAFDEALRDWPAEYHRERGLHLSRKACALALAGAMDEALDAGAQALVIARETGSQRVLHHLDFAATTMARRDLGGSDVRAFSEAVAAAAGERGGQRGPRRSG